MRSRALGEPDADAPPPPPPPSTAVLAAVHARVWLGAPSRRWLGQAHATPCRRCLAPSREGRSWPRRTPRWRSAASPGAIHAPLWPSTRTAPMALADALTLAMFEKKASEYRNHIDARDDSNPNHTFALTVYPALYAPIAPPLHHTRPLGAPACGVRRVACPHANPLPQTQTQTTSPTKKSPPGPRRIAHAF